MVDVNKKDWFKSNSAKGWVDILNKVRDTVNLALKENKSRKIDFIGHSSGGVMLRLYLSDEPFNNEIFNGKSHTKNLITLGRQGLFMHDNTHHTIDPSEQKNENMKELDSLKGIGKVSGLKNKINPQNTFDTHQEELKTLIIPDKPNDIDSNDDTKKDMLEKTEQDKW